MSETKPRLAFLLSGYGIHRRGAEFFLEHLVAGLRPHFDVTILSRARDGVVHIPAVARSNRFTGLLDRCPGIGHGLRFFNLGPLNLEWLTSCLGALPWLLRNHVDVFVPEGGIWGGLLGRLIRAVKGVPFVDIGYGAFSRWELASARQRPDCYVAISRVSAGEIAARVPGLRTLAIPLAVDTNEFTPEGAKASLDLPHPVVLYVGALEEVKRVDLAIRAIAEWGKGSLVIVGEGPLQAELEEAGRRLLGEKRFRRVAIGSTGLADVYRAADVFTSASRSEAFGLVYLEAIACNRPVVTQDDAIRREVLGDLGILCDCTDARAYAAALEQAVTKPTGDRLRQRAMQFDWSAVAAEYRRLFASLIADSASRKT